VRIPRERHEHVRQNQQHDRAGNDGHDGWGKLLVIGY
jgi:hypothetical protein